MRHFRGLLLAVALLVSATAAQADILSFGVAAGTNNNNFSVKNNDGAITNDWGYRAGLTVGVSLPFLSVTPEIWYTRNSFTITDPSLLNGTTAKVNNNALDIPIIVGLKVLPFIQLEVGPRFNIYESNKSNEVEDLNDITPTTGYVAGLKVTLLKKITFGARFNGNFGRRTTSFIEGGDTFEVGSHSYALTVGFKM